MLTLFIFKSSSRGTQYGIGTYIRELTSALQNHGNINIFQVAYKNSECNELKIIKESERLTNILIPGTINFSPKITDPEIKYASSVVKILSDFIPTNEQVVFQLNYFEELFIAKALKQKYSYPIVCVVHLAQYQQLFNGNKNKLIGLNIHKALTQSESTLNKEMEFYSIADHIVSVTRYMKEFLISYYNIESSKISIVPNGLKMKTDHNCNEKDKLRLRGLFGFRNEDYIILYVGRIDACKGLAFLAQAFQLACRKRKDLKLILIGQGNIDDFQSQFNTDFGRIVLTGFLKKELVEQFYSIADIGVVPSIFDHCPYTVLEMIANRIPLIMSRIDGLDEMLDDTNCLFVDAHIDQQGNVTIPAEILSEKIIQIIEDKKLRAEFSQNAYLQLTEKFLANQMAEKMFNLYKSLISGKNKNL
ncbi:MAG: glycosyltransferase [Methanococcaceae archaeon]